METEGRHSYSRTYNCLLAISICNIFYLSRCEKITVTDIPSEKQSFSQKSWSIPNWKLNDVDNPDPIEEEEEECSDTNIATCDDENPCTVDKCNNNNCIHEYGNAIYRHALQHPNPDNANHFNDLCHFSYGVESAAISAPFSSSCEVSGSTVQTPKLLFHSFPEDEGSNLSPLSGLTDLFVLKDENKLNPILSLLASEGPFQSENPDAPTIVAKVLSPDSTQVTSLLASEHIIPVYRFRKEGGNPVILLGHVSVTDISNQNTWVADPEAEKPYILDGQVDEDTNVAKPAFFACKGP